MNWQNFVRGLITSTLIFGGLLLFLTFFVSPERGMVTIVLYFVALFFFIVGLVALISFSLRRWWNHNELLFENVKTSLRQAVIFGLFVCAVLALSALRLLTWWDGTILAISFILIELYFKTRN